MTAVKLESFMKPPPAICQTLLHVLFTRSIFIYLWRRRSAALQPSWVGSFPAPSPIVFPWPELAVRATSGSQQDPTDPAQLGSGWRRPGYLPEWGIVGILSARGGVLQQRLFPGSEVKGCSCGRVSD